MTFRITQSPRTRLPAFLFSDSILSSCKRLPDGTAVPHNGLEAHAAAHQLCSGAASRTATQPSTREANWLCSWTSSSTCLSCVSAQALGNTSSEVWASCSSAGYGHALVYTRQEVFSSDDTRAFTDGCNQGTEGRENLPLNFSPALTSGS